MSHFELHKSYTFLLVPGSAPSSLTVVNKTATIIAVNWTALDSSDADGYVVNVISDTDTVQTVQVEGSSNNTITLNGLRGGTTYNITVRAYQQLLGPASSTISVQTLPGIAIVPVDVLITLWMYPIVVSLVNWTINSYFINCLSTNTESFHWLVNGRKNSNLLHTPIELLYHSTLLVDINPLGVSVNVTCIATYGGVNYKDTLILYGMIIL